MDDPGFKQFIRFGPPHFIRRLSEDFSQKFGRDALRPEQGNIPGVFLVNINDGHSRVVLVLMKAEFGVIAQRALCASDERGGAGRHALFQRISRQRVFPD